MNARTVTLDWGYRAVRPALFRLGDGDAEAAHHATLERLARLSDRRISLKLLSRLTATHASPVEVAGITFPNRVGLAAGVDKNGIALRAWSHLGFGHVELGTVTAQAQPGNPQPRLFRLRSSDAIINRMGFNNDGAVALATRLRDNGPVGIPVGVSIGKTKTTPVEKATRTT